MSRSSPVLIKKHIITSSHIQESITTSSASDPTGRLGIKQYIPLNNIYPHEGDLTIIGGHENGYVKANKKLILIM